MQGYLRLTYISRMSRSFAQSDLLELLEHSRTNNAVMGVSGMLFAGAQQFLQTLEGPEEKVVRLYGRILDDDRHTDSTLLDMGLIDRPMFSDWRMGYIEGSTAPSDMFSELMELRTPSSRREHTMNLTRRFLARLRASSSDN